MQLPDSTWCVAESVFAREAAERFGAIKAAGSESRFFTNGDFVRELLRRLARTAFELDERVLGNRVPGNGGEAVAVQLLRRVVLATKGFSGTSSDIPSNLSPVSSLWNLLSQHRDNFPLLTQELLPGGRQQLAPVLLRDRTERCVRLLESLREYRADASLIQQTVDEFGEIIQGRARLAELLELGNLLAAEYETQGYRSPSGRLELVAECLAERSFASILPTVLPKQIVLFLPSFISPLARTMWESLAALTELRVLLDPVAHDYDPTQLARSSQSHVASAVAWIRELQANGNCEVHTLPIELRRSEVVRALFDQSLEANAVQRLREDAVGISTFVAQDTCDEVQTIFAEIAAQKRKLSDIHLVVPNLDSYRDLLVEGASDYAIPTQIAQGKLIAGNPGIQFVENFLLTLEDPSLPQFIAWLTHPRAREEHYSSSEIREALSEIVADFPEAGEALELLLGASGAGVGQWLIPSGPDLQSAGNAIVERAVALGIEHLLIRNFPRFCAELLLSLHRDDVPQSRTEITSSEARKKSDALGLSRAPVCLAGMLLLLQRVNQLRMLREVLVGALHDESGLGTAESLRALRQLLLASWKPTGKRGAALGQQRDDSADTHDATATHGVPPAIAFLWALRTLRRASAELQWLQSMASSAQLLPQLLPLALFLDTARGLLRNLRLQSAHEIGGVVVTELLDLKTSVRPIVYFLGCSERSDFHDGFPGTFGRTNQLSEDFMLGVASRRYGSRGGDLAESSYLLRRVLQQAELLTFSYAVSSECGDLEPAPLLRDIATIAEARTLTGSHVPAENLSADTAAWSLRGEKLLRGRDFAQWTPFDGQLNTSSIAKLAAKHRVPFLAADKLSLSPSALEEYRDCPAKFFFRKVLRLAEREDSVQTRARMVSGSVVHDVLEQFFAPHAPAKENRARRLFEAGNFEAALTALRELAQQVLTRSGVPWDAHPQLVYERLRITSQLDELRLSGERGLLRAAFDFQHILELPLPEWVEFRFGGTDPQADPLRIPTSAGVMEISGRIDRVDGPAPYTLWDYKSSRPSAGDLEEPRLFQLPIYAAVLEQHFGQKDLIARGGYFCFEKLFLSAEELRKKPEPLVEHLARDKSGSRNVVNRERVRGRVDHALAVIQQLAESMLQGQFAPVLDSKYCEEHCCLGGVCDRNAVRLQRKHDAQILVLPDPTIVSTAPTFVPPRPARSLTQPRPLRLSAAQELACATDKDIILLAGAGSGKTAVLRTRIMRFLCQGVSLQQIAAITFTEDAAAEILRRVEQALTEALLFDSFEGTPLSAEQRQWLLAAKHELPSAAISTIHQFAARTVQLDRVLSQGVDVARVLNGPEAEQLKFRAVDEVLSADGASRNLVVEILKAGVKYFQLRTELGKITGHARLANGLGDETNTDTLGAEEYGWLRELKQREYAAELQLLANEIAQWCPEIRSWVDADGVKDSLKRQKFEELLTRAQQLQTVIHSTNSTPDVQEAFERFQSFVIEEQEHAVRASKKAPNYWLRFRDRLTDKRWRILSSPWQREESALRLAKRFMTLARESRRLYQDAKRQHGAVDFDDILVVAHNALCPSSRGTDAPEVIERRAAIIEKLQLRYRHMLVDEFQDTDPAQWQMLRAVSGIGSAGRPEGATLFVVGDDQQAIYGFRGGDVSSFRSAVDELQESGAQLVELTDNYRSSRKVVAAVNGLFDQIFALDSSEGGEDGGELPLRREVRTQVKKRPMIAQREEQTAGVEVLALPKAETLTSELESEAIAKIVAELLRSMSTDDSHLAAGEPRIAILVRKSREVRQVAEALQRANIPCQAIGSEDFYLRPEIQAMEMILKLASDPGDGIALAGVLRSPAFGCSDDDLVDLSLLDSSLQAWFRRNHNSDDAGDVSDWPAEVQALGIRCAQSIKKLWSRRSTVSTATALCQLVAEQGLTTAYQRAGNSDAAVHIERFVSRLRLAEMRSEYDGTAADALRWLHQQRRGGKATPSLATRSDAPVVVMTIHSAKGLEFPTVILPFLKWKTMSDHDFLSSTFVNGEGNETVLFAVRSQDEEHGYSRQETFLSWYLKSLRAQEKLLEEQRLFYVACTRARDQLILTVPETGSSSSKSSDKPLGRSSGPAKWLESLYREDAGAAYEHFSFRNWKAEQAAA